MTGGLGSATGGSGLGIYGPSGASETDGETFDDGTDFDDFDDWDYHLLLNSMSKNVKTFVLQPLVVGAAAAFGMSLGYALFDATASLFSGRRARTTIKPQ